MTRLSQKVGIALGHGFASNVRALRLDTVSTVRGSGWGDDRHVILLMILNPQP